MIHCTRKAQELPFTLNDDRSLADRRDSYWLELINKKEDIRYIDTTHNWHHKHEDIHCSTSCSSDDNGWYLTHLPLVPIYASKNWVIICPGNGLSPIRRQAINWANAGLLSTVHLGSYFSDIQIGFLSFSFKKMQLKMSSAKMATISSRGRSVN